MQILYLIRLRACACAVYIWNFSGIGIYLNVIFIYIHVHIYIQLIQILSPYDHGRFQKLLYTTVLKLFVVFLILKIFIFI